MMNGFHGLFSQWPAHPNHNENLSLEMREILLHALQKLDLMALHIDFESMAMNAFEGTCLLNTGINCEKRFTGHGFLSQRHRIEMGLKQSALTGIGRGTSRVRTWDGKAQNAGLV